jgi:hypothetical protein
MSKLDKLTDLANAATNPLSAAKSTVESARGLMNETYGLVEDARAIAEKESARREVKKERAAIKPSLDRERAVNVVTRRDTNAVITEYNAAQTAVKEAARQALIIQSQKEQEHAFYWSMSQEEREEYDRIRKEQNQKVIQEQLRITREKHRRKELNEMLIGVAIGLSLILGGGFLLFNWLSLEVRGESLIDIMFR